MKNRSNYFINFHSYAFRKTCFELKNWKSFYCPGEKYKIILEKLRWEEARKKCESENGELTSVKSIEENNFVKGFIIFTLYKV